MELKTTPNQLKEHEISAQNCHIFRRTANREPQDDVVKARQVVRNCDLCIASPLGTPHSVKEYKFTETNRISKNNISLFGNGIVYISKQPWAC